MSYPFLFWGREPADWFEGANDGHVYEVRFAKAPSPEQRLAIGKAFHAATKKGAATPADADWKWEGAWTIFRVGEKKAGKAREAFSHMEDVLHAMHGVAPIAEVLFWGARAEGKHAWDKWTRTKAKAPSKGPAWKEYDAVGLYGGARDKKLGAGASDPNFELARTGQKPAKANAGVKQLEIVSAIGGGFPKYPDDVPTKKLDGELMASRNGPNGTVVALTRKTLSLIAKSGKGDTLCQLPARSAVQLAVTTDGIAVTMTPKNEVFAYRIGKTALEPLGEAKAKKGGSLWANDTRVLFMFVNEKWEVRGWDATPPG